MAQLSIKLSHTIWNCRAAIKTNIIELNRIVEIKRSFQSAAF